VIAIQIPTHLEVIDQVAFLRVHLKSFIQSPCASAGRSLFIYDDWMPELWRGEQGFSSPAWLAFALQLPWRFFVSVVFPLCNVPGIGS
jgi:hypothetical protein